MSTDLVTYAYGDIARNILTQPDNVLFHVDINHCSNTYVDDHDLDTVEILLTAYTTPPPGHTLDTFRPHRVIAHPDTPHTTPITYGEGGLYTTTRPIDGTDLEITTERRWAIINKFDTVPLTERMAYLTSFYTDAAIDPNNFVATIYDAAASTLSTYPDMLRMVQKFAYLAPYHSNPALDVQIDDAALQADDPESALSIIIEMVPNMNFSQIVRIDLVEFFIHILTVVVAVGADDPAVKFYQLDGVDEIALGATQAAINIVEQPYNHIIDLALMLANPHARSTPFSTPFAVKQEAPQA